MPNLFAYCSIRSGWQWQWKMGWEIQGGWRASDMHLTLKWTLHTCQNRAGIYIRIIPEGWLGFQKKVFWFSHTRRALK